MQDTLLGNKQFWSEELKANQELNGGDVRTWFCDIESWTEPNTESGSRTLLVPNNERYHNIIETSL